MDIRDRLLDASIALSSERSLAGVLQRLVEIAAELTDATYGALGVIAPTGDRLVEFVTTGITADQRGAIGDLPVGHGLLGVLLTEAKPLRLANIAADPRSVGFPPHHPPMTSLLGAPVVSRRRVFGNVYLTDKRSAPEFSDEDERILIALAAHAGVAIENARLRERALAREQIVDAFREIATAMLGGAEPAEVLRLVARRARALVGADTTAMAIPHEAEGRLVLEVVDGLHEGRLRGAEFPRAGSVSGRVMAERAPLVLDDVAVADLDHPLKRFGDIAAVVVVPLVEGERVAGTLSAANRRGGRRFTDEDAELLSNLANQVVLALEYARAQGEARRVAVLEDRERIAKELHDGVIQSLFAVGMGLQGAAMTSGDDRLVDRLEGAVSEIDRVIRDLRNYIFGLRPGILADRHLADALRDVGAEFERRSEVITVVDLDETVASELSSSAGDVLQIAREALSNVGRHAKATTVRVSLYRQDGSAILEVDDDGVGFDEKTPRGDGLSNIEERAKALRGRMAVRTRIGDGTTVRLALPLVAGG